MAHKEQQAFCRFVRHKHKKKFVNCSVLDIGSLDINGNNRYLFRRYKYLGIDLGEGKNVDMVCGGHEFNYDTQFDIVISTECLEHDEYWKDTLQNAVILTKPGGIFMFTCASTGRQEHGTHKAHPDTSPFTHNHYKNITIEEADNCINASVNFSEYYFEYNPISKDLYFYGVKRSISTKEIYSTLLKN